MGIKDKSLVSFIIPTYNRGKYILKTINSVLNQSYTNLEILVIDDCSTDNTEEVVKGINDKRVKYYRNNNNSGAPFSRNRGIGLSNGDYINFLDDDDDILPNKTELQLEKFNSSNIENLGVVTCHVEYFRNTNLTGVKYNNVKGDMYKQLLKSYCIYATHSMLIKKTLLNDIMFDINLESGQEYDLMLQIAKKYNYDFVDEILCNVYESENQISTNFRKKVNGSKSLYKKYKSEFKTFGINFYLYNFLRFHYLIFKYYIGILIGKKVYKILF